MARRERAPRSRTFIYRSGTRIADTVIACDATAGGDLLFLSNGLAPQDGESGRRHAGRLAGARSARAQILTTPETLALMGAAGARLRRRTLTVGFGRPFGLGTLRLELLPSGVLPGAAALYCEDEDRRILYAGRARLGSPALGSPPGEVRAADALFLDATFGHPRFRFLTRDQAEERVRRFARAARDEGRAAVVLAAPLGPAQDLAATLRADGWKVRGHRAVVEAAAAYARARAVAGGTGTSAAAPVAPSRFSGKLRREEVLLWPAGAREAAAVRRALPDARVAWVSGLACDADTCARVGADDAIPFANAPDFEGLLAYATATGAREIAVRNGFAEDLAAALRARGADGYVLAPPRQIDLF